MLTTCLCSLLSQLLKLLQNRGSRFKTFENFATFGIIEIIVPTTRKCLITCKNQNNGIPASELITVFQFSTLPIGHFR